MTTTRSELEAKLVEATRKEQAQAGEKQQQSAKSKKSN
jgi:hypothetical protein